ncbi:MAG: hypothetical protein QOK08_1266 [Actinomycetota bacterium]|jgi:hypothetical protein|nr:YtxH protein [Glaciihabitans sp.]MDQ1543628.1 hypothetical protein [Actinomycetota bacterium]MDQ1562395.1 hypothetical protein [Actinomycetota bacterium]MDQ1563221.1 hypothetical protein [Actinomycetota bacterium]MDQ1572554.1 hypothetical protein [Actinomycetota bacterium]
MKGKILLVVGLGVGYVLGARAGRGRYEEIKDAVGKFWNDPRVQKQRTQAEEFVKDKAPDVAEFLSDGAKKVASQVTSVKSTAARSSAANTTAAKKPAARKTPSTRSTAPKK